MLFKVMVYGYQCGIYSSRKPEESCRYRIDFMWLLEGEKQLQAVQERVEKATGLHKLKDLQEYLTTIPFIKNEDILPIPVTHPRLEASLKKQKREIAQKERVRAVRARQREKKLAKIDRKALETESSGKLKISLCVNAILVVCVVAMFAMTLTSDSPTIVDYQSKLLNRYASWEQELTEREKAVSEKEQELGIQVDTEQTDFTD